MNKVKQQLSALAFLFAIILKCMCETVPEDLLTDNDEQLYKLQRDNLIDSIMEKIEPKTSEQTDKKVETHEMPQGKRNQIEDVADELPLRLKSIFPSPSRFSSADMETIKIHTSKNISTTIIDTRMEENKTIFHSVTSTQILGISSSKRQTDIIRSIDTSSSSNHENISSIYPFTDTTGNSTSVRPISQLFVSTMITSTESLSISTILAPHSISVVYETASSILHPTRTVFMVDQLLQSSSITETPKITIPRKIPSTSINLPTSTPISSELTSRRMPSIPDEHGYGGKTIFPNFCSLFYNL